MRANELFKFMKERHSIYLRRYEGQAKPWTKDPILQQYRFCNIFRELDTVTKWLRDNWYMPHQYDEDVWFSAVVARLVNWPDTLEEIGYPVPFDRDRFVEVMQSRKDRGEKVYTGAYMIRASHDVGRSKAEYIADDILAVLWRDRETMRPYPTECLDLWHQALMQYDGLGSFMAGQVVADVKYCEPMLVAPDWYDFAASGPGSRRGLNRVLGRDKNSPWTEGEWRGELSNLYDIIEPRFSGFVEPKLHAQDLQNSLCEFDKWSRVKNGEGFPRSKYNGSVML